MVKLLNNYFDVMVKEIINQAGFVDKFIGDAIMAVFKGDFHLDPALDASRAIKNKIAQLPEVDDHVKFRPNVSIGVNSGEVVSGNIGSVSLKRLDYTVIGNSVNTAQQLQSAGRPGQLIINEKSYQKVKESFQCRKVGEVSLKNKAQLQVIYEVVE